MSVEDAKAKPEDERMQLFFSDDRMSVEARFYAPDTGCQRLTKQEIIRQLNIAKVKFGISEEAIKNHIAFPNYGVDIKIAEGIQPVKGKNAHITYFFNTELKAKPKINSDGTVDFHQLGNISHIKAGDVLARLTPEKPGASGNDVFGNELRPPKLNRMILRYGKNITLSEDSLELISQVNGHAILVDGKVFVYHTYEVAGDVDNSTGDIDYEGNVLIKGNVRAGFKVIAAGNVEIAGVVEGATIKSGGDIILQRGIQGMGKGMLECGGNLIAKFIESSTALVTGNINTGTILHSKVSAVGDIVVEGKKGILIGGHIRSAASITAKTIGSAMGTTTVVEVGVDPESKDKLLDNQKAVQEKGMELFKLKQIGELLVKKKEMGQLDSEKKVLLIKTINNIKLLKSEIECLQGEAFRLSKELEVNENSIIKASGEFHSGVKLIISNECVFINSTAYHCQYKKRDGEIVCIPL